MFDLTLDLASRRAGALSAIPRIGFITLTSVSQLIGVTSKTAIAFMAVLPYERTGELSDAAAMARYLVRPANAVEAFNMSTKAFLQARTAPACWHSCPAHSQRQVQLRPEHPTQVLTVALAAGLPLCLGRPRFRSSHRPAKRKHSRAVHGHDQGHHRSGAAANGGPGGVVQQGLTGNGAGVPRPAGNPGPHRTPHPRPRHDETATAEPAGEVPALHVHSVLLTFLTTSPSVPCRTPHLRNLLFGPHSLQRLCPARPLAPSGLCRMALFADRRYRACSSGLAVP